MTLHRIRDINPSYRFTDDDILGFNIYSGNEVIGTVDDILVDEDGKFRYFVIHTGRWFSSKRVLLPVALAQTDYGDRYSDRSVHVNNLSREQVERLPEYDGKKLVDYDYEEQVRHVFRPMIAERGAMTNAAVNEPSADEIRSAPDMNAIPVPQATSNTAEPTFTPEATPRFAEDVDEPIASPTRRQSVRDLDDLNATPAIDSTPDVAFSNQAADIDTGSDVIGTTSAPAAFDRDTYHYSQDPGLYDLNEQNHRNIRLFEERLIADKTRQKTGEVAVGKRVETDTAQVSVPLEKERVVIEAVELTGTDTPVAPDEAVFDAGDVVRVEAYEETPDIQKEAFIREEVNVRKAVDQDVVEAADQVRREELDVKTDGQPAVEKHPNPQPTEGQRMKDEG